ncbi:MAG: hypothetical protein H0W64_08815 [Gammaproteobacteria bacterium]|nr:hypothetical protein [Gammaproteobacteria bacterium]
MTQDPRKTGPGSQTGQTGQMKDKQQGGLDRNKSGQGRNETGTPKTPEDKSKF